jgi:hypothetical protein
MKRIQHNDIPGNLFRVIKPSHSSEDLSMKMEEGSGNISKDDSSSCKYFKVLKLRSYSKLN